jgi:hypothetical protein
MMALSMPDDNITHAFWIEHGKVKQMIFATIGHDREPCKRVVSITDDNFQEGIQLRRLRLISLEKQKSTPPLKYTETEERSDSLDDWLIFMEEQKSTPPLVYTETEEQSSDGAQINPIPLSPAAESVVSDGVWTLLVPLWEVGQKLLRPRLRAGYRRLEWRCVRNS